MNRLVGALALLTLLAVPAWADLASPKTGAFTDWSNMVHGATLSASPSAPTGNATGTYKMMGLGSTCPITPATTGRVVMQITGIVTNNTGGDGGAIKIAYGSGAAPNNGDAATGTVLTNAITTITGTSTVPFTVGSIAQLTVGTVYWIDLQLSNQGGGTASVSQLTCTVYEVN